ncbi:MAG: alpha/beta fold hydrolase [Acidimicrobiales bacterium]
MSLLDTLGSDDYDEFGLLHENAAEWDIPFERAPVVSRDSFALPSGQTLSYLRWGAEEPELVFLHGGAQNAHTWDTVLLALGRPAVAVDLPGHGHSDRRADRDYGPWRNAEAVATLLESVAPAARCVTGMSLGGATTIRLAAQRPDLCRRAVFVDVTPQINDPTRQLTTAERGTVSLIAGPPVYDRFEAMADAAVALSPYRSAAGVRRGVRHNARRLDDGRWTWRYDLFGPPPGVASTTGDGGPGWVDFTPLWEDVSAISVPVLFVRGGLSPFVRDEDLVEMHHRLPSLEVVVVDGAGHAVQSDRPLVLADLVRSFAL